MSQNLPLPVLVANLMSADVNLDADGRDGSPLKFSPAIHGKEL